MHRIFYLVAILLLSSCGIFRPTTLKPDLYADKMLGQGKEFLKKAQYREAWDSFELAREQPFSRSTTASVYLAGLSAYYLNYDDIAIKRFETVIREFPKSRYVADARYHLAAAQLRSGKSDRARTEALLDLMTMVDNATDTQLARDALVLIKQALFEQLNSDFLAAMYRRTPAGFQDMMMEAMLFRQVKEGNYEGARQRYQGYLKRGGKDTPFLQTMFPEGGMASPEPQAPKLFEPEIIKMALFLPLYLNDFSLNYSNGLPDQNRRAIEFYEGFQMAVKAYEQKARKDIFLKVYDTRRDTLVTQRYVAQLDSLGPHVVVGDIYNTQSRIISAWAESREVPQIVPISPAQDLVEGKSYTFLAHPTAYTHGKVMAEHAWYQLGLREVSVFTDRSRATEQLADGFIETFLEIGGRIDTLVISRHYEDGSKDEIPDLVEDIPDSTGVYIPLMGNEDAASLIVNWLMRVDKKVHVMGSPHFRSRYTTLPRYIKESYRLLFTTSHLNKIEMPAYQDLYRQYIQTFKLPPSDNVIQGYDLGYYLLQMMDEYDPGTLEVPLNLYLRISPRKEGIHLNYLFEGTQSNQHVNIGQYTEEGVVRVN